MRIKSVKIFKNAKTSLATVFLCTPNELSWEVLIAVDLNLWFYLYFSLAQSTIPPKVGESIFDQNLYSRHIGHVNIGQKYINQPYLTFNKNFLTKISFFTVSFFTTLLIFQFSFKISKLAVPHFFSMNVRVSPL